MKIWRASNILLLVLGMVAGLAAHVDSSNSKNKGKNKLSSAFEFVARVFVSTEGTTAPAEDHPRGLQVIGAGFSRTGTKSTEEALRRVIGGKVYDFTSFASRNCSPPYSPSLSSIWNKCAKSCANVS